MIGQSSGLQKNLDEFLDAKAHGNGLPWTHTATLFLKSQVSPFLDRVFRQFRSGN